MVGDQKVGHQKPQANSSLPVFSSVSLSIFSKPLGPSGLQASCILSSPHVSVKLAKSCLLSPSPLTVAQVAHCPLQPSMGSFSGPPISSWAHQKF